MADQHVAISLKRFLLLDRCPTEWTGLDLYVFRDDSVAFYVGQSHFAFGRVWEHLLGGFKGHSLVGRFIWCNWPRSMQFTIELWNSQAEEFSSVGNEVNAAERQLIQQWSPCFNVSLNSQPTQLPAYYLPPNAKFRRRQSFRKFLFEAERAVKAEESQAWLKELE